MLEVPLPCRLLYCGFSCKFASCLARGVGDGVVCIEERCGSTGVTFWGLCAHIGAQRPQTFLLDNVPGLLQNGRWLAAMSKLRSKGYAVYIRLMCATSCGFPISRERLWMFCIRGDLLPHGIAEVDVCQWLDELLELFVQLRSNLRSFIFLAA